MILCYLFWQLGLMNGVCVCLNGDGLDWACVSVLPPRCHKMRKSVMWPVASFNINEALISWFVPLLDKLVSSASPSCSRYSCQNMSLDRCLS